MYNSDIPTRAELPSSAQLIKSTIIAIVTAAIILVTIVLPSEYGIDPTGIGRMLKLAEMGEIKQQLAEEAEADRQKDLMKNPTDNKTSSNLLDNILGSIIKTAHAHSSHDHSAMEKWSGQISVILTPGEGTEIKLVMEKGAEAEFLWEAKGGVVNFDLHGDGGDNNISYEKGRAVSSKEGVLKAAFTGNHGWFWRNRGKQDVTVTLSVRGDYSKIIRP